MNATEFVAPSTEDEAQEMMEAAIRYKAMLHDAKERVIVLEMIIGTIRLRLDEYYARIKENDR